MQDKTIGIIIVILAVVALGIVFFVNVGNSLDSLADPLVGDGLGRLCTNPSNCQDFCQNNKGRCNDYCQENPSNPLCSTLLQ